MLLLLPDIDCSTHHFERVVQQLKHCHDHLRTYYSAESEFKYDEFPVKLIQKCLPKEVILGIVQKFQNYITLVIIQSIFKQDAIQQVIQVLDFFYRANNQKPRAERVSDNEFYNEAINQDVDLKKQVLIFLQEWDKAKRD